MSDPKIHFMSMVGVEYDWELIPYFIEHYSRFDFDSYTIFLHSNKPLPACRREKCMSTFRDLEKWHASFVNIDGGYWAGGKEQILSAFANSLPEEDFVVTADADEFHDMSVKTYRNLIVYSDIVLGKLVDCYGDTLSPVDGKRSLASQYPRGDDVEELNIGRCGEINRIKIMANRTRAAVSYIGNHVYWGDLSRLRVAMTYDVLHYTFRSSLPWRMATRWYNRPETVRAVCARFGISYHPAIALCAGEQKKRFRLDGWMPGADEHAIAGGGETAYG